MSRNNTGHRDTNRWSSMASKSGRLLGAVLILGLIGANAVVGYVPSSPEAGTACTVTDKDRSTNSKGKSDQRVYMTCDDEAGATRTYQVRDAALQGIFDSSDTYAQITVGETYEITTIGLRIPILSMFPNITEAALLPAD